MYELPELRPMDPGNYTTSKMAKFGKQWTLQKEVIAENVIILRGLEGYTTTNDTGGGAGVISQDLSLSAMVHNSQPDTALRSLVISWMLAVLYYKSLELGENVT